ncbi:S-adenosyl-L-methionine-dependent methyltransferase [Camillea tinctor]|nr:S-adenosyl-L-methionine-dependent methyltransferase [Camillea tinctor]
MATFARSTFSASTYAAFRPTYPPSLFRTVLSFHQLPIATPPYPPPQGTALLDIGCGHGLIARDLSPYFASVVAIDPSPGMIAEARRRTDLPAVSLFQGGVDDISVLMHSASVDMAVAGQAAHWFDYRRAWRKLASVVKPGGTLAFWGYKDNVLIGKEQATAIMERFVYGQGEVAPGWQGMGPYWEQPGRNILRNLLREVRPPESEWKDVTRLEHEPGRMNDPEETYWLRKTMKLGEVEGYTRTFSCFSGWKDAHPEKKSRAEGGDGDIVDVMWGHMVEAVPEWKALGERWREAEVVSDWGTYILMARRR